ncbi:MAG: histidine phosphatase family protein [Spirulina sp. DLM2.Bin59]|nr:MAG: histidine phosphatase family protein [Spirulina sp. DLM2.Bin59]
MTTRVIIVRHGQSTYNAQKRIQGRCDESVLTEKGRREALRVGEALGGVASSAPSPIAALYHSPLQRAAQTAEIIAQHLQLTCACIPSPQLLEVDLPLWEGLSREEVQSQSPAAYQQWHDQPSEFSMMVNGQPHYPVRSLYAQTENFWQTLLPAHQGETVLIVAHNGINRCLIMSALGMDPSRYQSIQQSNCCINILNFSGGWGDPVQAESLNQLSHMGIILPSFRPPHNQLRILLVRHGETDWNREGRFQGIQDIPLNDNGRHQASKAADYLKTVQIDAAVSSPMLRPKETAEIILQHHPGVELALEPQFCEIGHGLWEGKLEKEIEAAYPGLLAQWKTAPETVQMPEGENLQQVWDRVMTAWDEMVERYSRGEAKTLLVVAHDAVNKCILCGLLGLKPQDIWAIKQGNGAVTVIDYPQGAGSAPIVQTLNLTTYLGSGIFDKTAAGAL